jgi:hypothetical protein
VRGLRSSVVIFLLCPVTITGFTLVSVLERAVILIKTRFCITICGDNIVQYNAINGQEFGQSNSVLSKNKSRGKSDFPDWTQTATCLTRMTTKLSHDVN